LRSRRDEGLKGRRDELVVKWWWDDGMKG
jgi:hypothetical protein